MYIEETEISCGIQQLVDIGEHPTFDQYKEAMTYGNSSNSHDGLGCFIIASVPWKWKNSIKFLKSVGFKTHGVRTNPNSKNKITLLSKQLSKKERKRLVGNRCRDCDEIIEDDNPHRRVCDYCKQDRKESRRLW